MSGVMPPEPPPVNSEADYANSGTGARKPATNALVVGSADVPFFGLDLPIPAHLIGRERTPELNKAVALVLQDSDESVPKRGWNDFHKYKYATADDIRMHVAKKIGHHGLSYEQHEVGYTPFGSLIAVHYYFVLSHESGETAPPQRVSVLTMMVTNNGKPDDKAFSKACVLALKDWSKGRFSIATGEVADDPDYAPAPQPPPRAPARTPAKPASSEAFRSAGLPPKVTPATNGHMDQPFDPDTGELADTWLPDALHAIGTTPDQAEWLRVVEQVLLQAPSGDSITAISQAPSVVVALQKAPAKVRKQINDWMEAARKRIAAEVFPDAPSDGVDAAIEVAS